MIIVAGEALIDLLIHPDGRLAAVPGGGPFSAARTIARLGGEVAFLGRLSTDRFGQTLRDALEADGVDLTLAETTDAPTTLAIAELDANGAATYRFHTAETAAPGLTATVVERALATGPAALHVGTLGLVLEPMAGALAAGLEAAPTSTLVMVDPNARPLVIPNRTIWLTRLKRVLRRADVVKLSTDDADYIATGVPLASIARDMLAVGPAVVLVTDGARPVRVHTHATTFEIPVPVVPVVDSVGAGDAFGGAFLARWIERGLTREALADEAVLEAALRDAVEKAVQVATLTCTRPGADPPRRADLGW